MKAGSPKFEGALTRLSDGNQVDTAVVFVHGFLGDAQGTWLNFQEFICAADRSDEPWSRCDVYFFAYPSFRQDITESATQLLKFIGQIFPDPPTSIFHVSKRVPGIPDIPVDLSSRKPEYKKLVLVGHSEGGVVIRRAVDLAYNWKQMPVLHSRLALFAPAHKGVKLSGWIGACLAVGRIDAVAMPILRFSPAFSEMKDKDLLDEIEEHTSSIWRRQPPRISLSRACEPTLFMASKNQWLSKASIPRIASTHLKQVRITLRFANHARATTRP